MFLGTYLFCKIGDDVWLNVAQNVMYNVFINIKFDFIKIHKCKF